MFNSNRDKIENQGNSNVIIQYNGLSSEEVRNIALDIFKANFYELSENAAKTAYDRIELFTEKTVKRFFEEIPNIKDKLQEPSVQSSIYNTQKEVAKTGDINLEDRLLDLLITRIKSEERSLQQIVLDEAIMVLPKLTDDQIKFITLIFSAIQLNHNITSLENFNILLKHKILAFYPTQIVNHSFYNHLKYSGCCTILSEGSTYKSYEIIIQNRYSGLFNKGFSEETFKTHIGEGFENYGDFITTCLQNTQNYQFNALNNDVFDAAIERRGLQNHQVKLKELLTQNTFTEQEITAYISSLNKNASNFLRDWKSTEIKSMTLTSVGYAIACLNYNKITGEKINLEHFI